MEEHALVIDYDTVFITAMNLTTKFATTRDFGVVTTDDVRRDEGDLSPTPRCVADQLRERDAGQSPLERRDQLQTAIERGSKV